MEKSAKYENMEYIWKFSVLTNWIFSFVTFCKFLVVAVGCWAQNGNFFSKKLVANYEKKSVQLTQQTTALKYIEWK